MKAIMPLLALCLVAPCLAEQQAVTTGPYEISFDLGIPKASYSVDVSAPKTIYTPAGLWSMVGETITEYQINIINDIKTGGITITLFEFPTDRVSFSPSELASRAKSMMEKVPQIRDVQESARMIRGSNGGMASGKIEIGFGLYQDIYSVIYIPDARLVVSMVSTYPWDGGTHQLLKTIYVQKNA